MVILESHESWSLKVAGFLILFFAISDSHAQKFEWAKRFAGDNLSSPFSIKMNSSSELFLGGGFEKNISFGQMTLNSRGAADAFIARMDTTGNLLSVIQFSGSTYTFAKVDEIDSNDDLVVHGNFTGTLEVGDTTINPLPARDDQNFIAKFSRDGDLLWIRILDLDGAVYLGPVTIDRDDNIFAVYMTVDGNDRFLAIQKYNPDGLLLAEQALSETTDGRHILPTGIVITSGGEPLINLIGSGDLRISDQEFPHDDGEYWSALTKLSADLDPEWTKIIFTAYVEPYTTGTGFAIDAANNIYITSAMNKVVLQKLDKDGEFQWGVSYNGNVQDVIWTYGITVDPAGSVYLCGSVNNNFELDGVAVSTTFDNSVAYVMKFDRIGQAQWVKQSNHGFNDGLFFVQSPSGSIYFSGHCAGRTYFDAISLPDEKYGSDIFVTKLSDPTFVTPSIRLGDNIELCSGDVFTFHANGFISYEWSDGSNDSTFVANKPGEYFVRAMDYRGNQVTDTVKVSLCLDESIPNVITPNGDGLNQNFVIEGLDLSRSNELLIYDRWGKKIFETHSYQNDWDGQEHTAGIYFYRFKKATGDRDCKGFIHIIK